MVDIGFVTAIGIDPGEDERFTLTFQIINPRNVIGGEQKGGVSGPPVAVYETSGENLIEIGRKATQQISRRLYYAHADLVVIGEELARKGIRDVLDLLSRSQEFRENTTVVIAKDGKAKDILNTLTPVDQIPDSKIIKTIIFAQDNWGESIETRVSDVFKEIFPRQSTGDQRI